MNGLKYKIISVILPVFLFVGALKPPFLLEDVKGAEIGMVGALPGSVTLWEIFETIWAASGVIIANDEVQTAAADNFGSSAYTLSEMQSMGFTPIGVDGSNALDWDWSDLEDELENSNSEDAKIIKGIFSQNGGSGSGGDNNDPWYKKAVNWVKSVVQKGYVEIDNTITGLQNGETSSVTMSLGALSSMISSQFLNNVKIGAPVTADINGFPLGTQVIVIDIRGGTLPTYPILGQSNFYTNDSNVKIIFYFIARSGSGSSQRVRYGFVAANKNDYAVSGGLINNNILTEQSANGDSVSSNDVSTNFSISPRSYYVWQSGTGSTQQLKHTYVTINPHINYETLRDKFDVLGNVIDTDNFESGKQAAINEALAYINGDIETIDVSSPDIITPIGNAKSNDGMWVPTPYMEPGTHLEIIPQPNIDEFTQYINEEVPDPQQAGEAWIDTVNPYVTSNPTPAPTTRPMPTTKPNVTPIPAGDPGGEDNPITVTDPDPMPEIEGGFGTTYELMDYFPFCIPADFVRAYKIFEVSEEYRHAPYIDWNLRIQRFGIDEHIVLDFSLFDPAAAVFRVLVFISFCIGLLMITKTLIWS